MHEDHTLVQINSDKYIEANGSATCQQRCWRRWTRLQRHKLILIALGLLATVTISLILSSTSTPSPPVATPIEKTNPIVWEIIERPPHHRQNAVVDALRHAWKGYKKLAWGHDTLHPVYESSSDSFGLGFTIIDSLDTLYLMGMQKEFDEARAWIKDSLNLHGHRSVSVFEVTIRALGGLLSAYHFTDDEMFLLKANELGERLMPAFNSLSGIPYSEVNLKTAATDVVHLNMYAAAVEATSLQMEFRDLSRCVGDSKYENAIEKVNRIVHEAPKTSGLITPYIDVDTGEFVDNSRLAVGALADSYYEYLLKQWIQTGKKPDDNLIKDYKQAVEGIMKILVRTSPKGKHVFVGLLDPMFEARMEHLVCYLPGTLLLGYHNGMPESHLRLAQELMETCYQMYVIQPTHLAPESTSFDMDGYRDQDMFASRGLEHNILRPEVVESLYYFYALTGNTTYQDMGWTIFSAFEKYSKVDNGYTSIDDVTDKMTSKSRDTMETFFLGETLKYFYLLFDDDRKRIDLDKFVFNTEAHLLPIRSN